MLPRVSKSSSTLALCRSLLKFILKEMGDYSHLTIVKIVKRMLRDTEIRAATSVHFENVS